MSILTFIYFHVKNIAGIDAKKHSHKERKVTFYRRTQSLLWWRLEEANASARSEILEPGNEPLWVEGGRELSLEDVCVLLLSIRALDSTSNEHAAIAQRWQQRAENEMIRHGILEVGELDRFHCLDCSDEPALKPRPKPAPRTPGLRERFAKKVLVARKVARTVLSCTLCVAAVLATALAFVAFWTSRRVVTVFRHLHHTGHLRMRPVVFTLSLAVLVAGGALASVIDSWNFDFRSDAVPVTESIEIAPQSVEPPFEFDYGPSPKPLRWQDVMDDDERRAMELLVDDPRVAHVSRHIQCRRDGSWIHDGIDIATMSWKLLATTPEDGTVVCAENRGSLGNVVIVQFVDGTHGLFGHLHRIDVRIGQSLRRGEAIGVVGSTGGHRGAGRHLHFGLYDNTLNGKLMFDKQNPDEFFGAMRNQRAGVDPWPWLAVRWQRTPAHVLAAQGNNPRAAQGL